MALEILDGGMISTMAELHRNMTGETHGSNVHSEYSAHLQDFPISRGSFTTLDDAALIIIASLAFSIVTFVIYLIIFYRTCLHLIKRIIFGERQSKCATLGLIRKKEEIEDFIQIHGSLHDDTRDSEAATGHRTIVERSMNVLMKVAPKSTKKKKKKPKKVKYIDFNKYAEKFPVGFSEEEKKERKDLFASMDQSGKGTLSLAEIELGIKSYVGEEIYLMKPAIKMAYKIARGSDPTDKGEEQYFVDRREFRVLLVNMRRFMELYAAFDHMDTGDDNRIDLEEFRLGVLHLKEWGVEVENPEEEFQVIDQGAGGQILFDEFCFWALKLGLRYDKDMSKDHEGATEDGTNALDVLIEKAPPPKKRKKKKKKKKAQYIDFDKYAEKLPVGMSDEEKKKRKELFNSMDQSSNGSLSLAEIELGIKNYVGEEIYMMKPAIKMAYKIARGAYPTDKGEGQYFVDGREFRVFLVNMRRFMELYAALDHIDAGDDNRIDLNEFKQGIVHLKEWGVEVENPEEEFSVIGQGSGGQILFDEFCFWALKKGLDYDKDMPEDHEGAEATDLSNLSSYYTRAKFRETVPPPIRVPAPFMPAMSTPFTEVLELEVLSGLKTDRVVEKGHPTPGLQEAPTPVELSSHSLFQTPQSSPPTRLLSPRRRTSSSRSLFENNAAALTKDTSTDRNPTLPRYQHRRLRRIFTPTASDSERTNVFDFPLEKTEDDKFDPVSNKRKKKASVGEDIRSLKRRKETKRESPSVMKRKIERQNAKNYTKLLNDRVIEEVERLNIERLSITQLRSRMKTAIKKRLIAEDHVNSSEITDLKTKMQKMKMEMIEMKNSSREALKSCKDEYKEKLKHKQDTIKKLRSKVEYYSSKSERGMALVDDFVEERDDIYNITMKQDVKIQSVTNSNMKLREENSRLKEKNEELQKVRVNTQYRFDIALQRMRSLESQRKHHLEESSMEKSSHFPPEEKVFNAMIGQEVSPKQQVVIYTAINRLLKSKGSPIRLRKPSESQAGLYRGVITGVANKMNITRQRSMDFKETAFYHDDGSICTTSFTAMAISTAKEPAPSEPFQPSAKKKPGRKKKVRFSIKIDKIPFKERSKFLAVGLKALHTGESKSVKEVVRRNAQDIDRFQSKHSENVAPLMDTTKFIMSDGAAAAKKASRLIQEEAGGSDDVLNGMCRGHEGSEYARAFVTATTAHQKQRMIGGKTLREVTNILSEIFRPSGDAKYSRNESFVAWCQKKGLANPMLNQPSLTGLKNKKGTRELNLLSNEDFVARNIDIICEFLTACIDPTNKNTLARDMRNSLQTNFYYKNYALAAAIYSNFSMPFQRIIATLSFAELATFSLEWFGHVRCLVKDYIPSDGGGASSVRASSLKPGVDTFLMLGPVIGYFEFLPGLCIPDLPNVSVSREDTRIDWANYKIMKASKQYEASTLVREAKGRYSWKKHNELITLKFHAGKSGIGLCKADKVVVDIHSESQAYRMGVKLGWSIQSITCNMDIEHSNPSMEVEDQFASHEASSELNLNGQEVRLIDSGKRGIIVGNIEDGRYCVKLDKDSNYVELFGSEFDLVQPRRRTMMTYSEIDEHTSPRHHTDNQEIESEDLKELQSRTKAVSSKEHAQMLVRESLLASPNVAAKKNAAPMVVDISKRNCSSTAPKTQETSPQCSVEPLQATADDIDGSMSIESEFLAAETSNAPYTITFDQRNLTKSKRDNEAYEKADYVPTHRIRLDDCTAIEKCIWISRLLLGIAVAYFSAEDFAIVMRAVATYASMPFIRQGNPFPHLSKMRLKATQADFTMFAQTILLTYVEIFNHMNHRLDDYIGDDATFATFSLGLASLTHHLLDRCGARVTNDIAETIIGVAALLFGKMGKMHPALLEQMTVQRHNKSFEKLCNDDIWYDVFLKAVEDLNLKKEARVCRTLEKIRIKRKGDYIEKKASEAKRLDDKRRKDVIKAQEKDIVFSVEDLDEALVSIDRSDKPVKVCKRLKLELLKDHVRFYKLLYRDRRIAGSKPPRLAQTGLKAEEIRKLLVAAIPYVRQILKRDLPSSMLLERGDEDDSGLVACSFLTADKQIFKVKLSPLELARLGFV